MKGMSTVFLLVLCFFEFALCQDYTNWPFNPLVNGLCMKSHPKPLWRYGPRGNETAGPFKKIENVITLQKCFLTCCEDQKCNVVFMYKNECFHIECHDNYVCAPIFRTEPRFQYVNMILVRPVQPSQSWDDVLNELTEEEYSNRDEELEQEASFDSQTGRDCEIGIYKSCPELETCEPLTSASARTRYGVCQCQYDYTRDRKGNCMPEMKDAPSKMEVTPSSLVQTLKPSDAEQQGTSNKPVKMLVVSVLSKTVQLPDNEATLSAYTVPAEQPGEHFVINWKLISQPEGGDSGNSGTMNDQNGGTLKLGHLIEGIYTFKVTVSAPGAYGETFANVTVLPPKRINQPPVAIITPMSQTVKLPNTAAVLDGSTSHDDDLIVAWHWDLQGGPLGYQPALEDSSTLQLKNLLPGNYTFKLTVEDSDHATNSTTANITVVKITDYPPEANAGQDVIVYLPVNNITLNGNLSSDDKGIVSWEWTKSVSDQDKAVDMQKTRTPYLELSNLEEGMYTFILKVTDDNGQTSSSEVHVFVKPPTNKPPIANAGQDVVVSLPKTWVQLDASGSSDDIKIVSYHWKQLSGPTHVAFNPVNASKTNASELTKGEYEIQVTVVDSNGNIATDSVIVTVNQNENAAPKANAGGDQTVILPVSVVTLNGSSSSDDLAIKKWQWFREGSSLALGRVVGDSDNTPTLLLTDLIPGRYVFRLRVTDGQGASAEDTVSVIVKPDPYMLHLVELTLNIEGGSLTVSQQQSLEGKLALLLRDGIIHIRELRREQNTGRAVLVFYVGQQDDKAILAGPQVVRLLKEKLEQDSGLLEMSVANVQTAVCQSNCSGHGVCDRSTRLCLCEAFWMQNLVNKYFGDGESNCDWSILYVVIVMFGGILLVAGWSWALSCLMQRACRRPRKRQRYSLIDDGEEAAMRVLNKSVMASESESDSESESVLFKRRDKVNGEARNGNRPKNGFNKLGRRIKT